MDYKMNNCQYSLEFQVRDYECDLQGIVNNAVYQNYLEHTRHQFLLSMGVDFSGLSKEGVNLVVIRTELDYKSPLKSGDSFTIAVELEQVSPLRFCFNQEIYKHPDNQLVLTAKVFGTAINEKGKPIRSENIINIIKK